MRMDEQMDVYLKAFPPHSSLSSRSTLRKLSVDDEPVCACHLNTARVTSLDSAKKLLSCVFACFQIFELHSMYFMYMSNVSDWSVALTPRWIFHIDCCYITYRGPF